MRYFPTAMIRISLHFFLILFFSSSLLSGCTAMPKQSCHEIDWFELGRRQGAFGKKLERPEKLVKTCNLSQLPQIESVYRNGHQAGLADYCMPDNGFQMGHAGYEYSSACPEALESEFQLAFSSGRKAFELEYSDQQLKEKVEKTLKDLAKPNIEKNKKIALEKELKELKQSRRETRKKLSTILKSESDQEL